MVESLQSPPDPSTLAKWRAVLRVVVAVTIVVTGSAAARGEEFRIASWRLTDLWHEPGRPLRNGSPVRGAGGFAELRAAAAALDADVVALHAVGSPQAVRRVFPATDYYMVFSPVLRDRVLADPRALSDPRRRSVYVAIVVRRDRGIRVRYVERMAGGTVELGDPNRASDLAAELLIKDRAVWLLAADLPPTCQAGERVDDEACRAAAAQAAATRNWINQRRARNQTYIVAAGIVGPAADTLEGASDQLWRVLADSADGAPATLSTVSAVVAEPAPMPDGTEPSQMRPLGYTDPLADPSRNLDPEPEAAPTGVSLTDGIRSILDAVGEALAPAPEEPASRKIDGMTGPSHSVSQLARVHADDLQPSPLPGAPPLGSAPRLANVEIGSRLARYPGGSRATPCAVDGGSLVHNVNTQMLIFDPRLAKAPALAGFGARAQPAGISQPVASATLGGGFGSAGDCAIYIDLRL